MRNGGKENQELAIIDYQDAVVGPVSYDLVSWIWDRYIHWPRQTVEKWIRDAHGVFSLEHSVEEWQRQCELMGLQRNLKIVGIFARLNYRDNKTGYLQLIPQFAKYIKETLAAYPEFNTVEPLIFQRLKRDL